MSFKSPDEASVATTTQTYGRRRGRKDGVKEGELLALNGLNGRGVARVWGAWEPSTGSWALGSVGG